MSLTYALMPMVSSADRKGHTPIASAAFASPWNDIPLQRLLLSLRLDDQMPGASDWSALPGSPDGVHLYKHFAGLLKRWMDSIPQPQTAVDRAIDCELAAIVPGKGQAGESVSVHDAIAALDWALARVTGERTGIRTELSLLYALLALCQAASGDTMIVRRTEIAPRTHEGPINYYTSGLEGFDVIAAVEVLDDGAGLWCRFASGYCYRIPLDYVRQWLEINPDETISKARRLSGGSEVHLRLQSGPTLTLSANAILRYCEPDYADASPRTPWEQQLLDDAIASHGSFRQAC